MKNKKRQSKFAIIIVILIIAVFLGYISKNNLIINSKNNINYVIVNENSNQKQNEQSSKNTNNKIENTNEQNSSDIKENTVPELPKLINDSGIFSEYYNKAYEQMSKMTLDEKIGQVMLVRVPESDAKEIMSKKQFGGYILFGKDTKNKTSDQLKLTIQSWKDVSIVSPIIAVDEEGGTVVRISNNSKLSSHKFQSSQNIYKSKGYEGIKNDTIEKSELLSILGINVNLAPVADVSTNSKDYIYKRSFGKNANETSEYIKTVIKAGKTTNVSNVLKHFPGYGNNVDTHTGISIDKRTLQSFRESDFLPFKAGIDEGAEAILVSHNIITNIEDSIPASLSPKIHEILRNELGFTGIIMTDDLAMQAISEYVSKPSVSALKAGNDMIIISDYESGINDIKESIDNGLLDEETLNKAVTRVLAWKYYKKIIPN